MDDIVKRAAVAALLLALLGMAACGDGPRQPAEPPGEERAETLDKKALWTRLLPGQPRPHVPDTDTGGTVTHSVRLLDPRRAADRKHLDGIHLPRRATKHQVRQYVASVLEAAYRVRDKAYSSRDPEIALIERVGDEHVDVLLEPLVHLDSMGGDIYLIEAVKRLANENHKPLVLDALACDQQLISVVVAKGWTEDAAPTLLRVLEERSRYLSPQWVTAAAQVAGPEHYDHLRFQLAEGQLPIDVWEAIRDLPGMEPLDEFVEKTWRNATEKEYHHRWYELAVIAAHYGHIDALEAFARRLPHRQWWWGMFQSLTGYGHGRNDRQVFVDAQEWLATHKADLVFDRVKRRYSVKGTR